MARGERKNYDKISRHNRTALLGRSRRISCFANRTPVVLVYARSAFADGPCRLGRSSRIDTVNLSANAVMPSHAAKNIVRSRSRAHSRILFGYTLNRLSVNLGALAHDQLDIAALLRDVSVQLPKLFLAWLVHDAGRVTIVGDVLGVRRRYSFVGFFCNFVRFFCNFVRLIRRFHT
ncbi:MAG: hypothetical protein IKL84_04010 [Clostridia bacterium]|nr:hypothetical protein [Clostridia bacterium]